VTAIDKIRAALEAAAEYPNSVYAALKAENALAALAELEAELVELRARLAAIDAAPAVAWLSTDCIGERYLCFSCPDDQDPVIELIARPEAK